MRDTLLFVALPYGALALLVLVPFVRSFVAANGLEDLETQPVRHAPWAWRYGLGLVLAGHALGFLLPRQVIAFDRLPLSVLVIETSAFGAGALALIGLAVCLSRALAERGAGGTGSQEASLADTLLCALLALAILSGLATALVYRWGTSWVGVTIVPYLRSLLLLRPEVELIAEMPALVRLHVLAGVGAAAVLPFSRWGAAPARLLAGLWRASRPVQTSTTLR
jgi:nitrate reductase gamma subunit